ncbi:thiamine transport system ATP-binding protein [Arcanobacterium pluranimalium]|uniref:ABC transporter ATP-binding protein n=1 Tax=Arcanobacterium pluranimalium TaxID=108028 RepID=UPI00195B401D|nr:ABC transporter ATP-binding protein [Arcanobacterium pluranimalium]MBM7824281.1 thiamine transport system ATP-binding protein [Arcanobacterium pluranimalium]
MAVQNIASPAQTTPALELRSVNVTYPNGFTAVTGVDLTVAHGEIVALLGASGSGKSTLLRAIAGLERVSAGSIFLDGRNVCDVPVHERNTGMVFQDGQLFPHRNVFRNISYGLEMRRMPRNEREERVRELLKLVDLEDFAQRPVNTLSGGQAQRVALARSLAPKPSLLLLDEPLSALDQKLRQTLAVQLRNILTTTATTSIFVTHDEHEAQKVADRVLVMEAGRISG